MLICALLWLFWVASLISGQLVSIAFRQRCFLNKHPHTSSLLFQRKAAVCAYVYMLCCYKLQEMSAPVIEGNDAVTGHIISTTIGGKNGEPKRVSTGSFFLLLPHLMATI